MRYFFHIQGEIITPDHVGTSFETLAEARAHAIALSERTLIERNERGQIPLELQVTVLDASGATAFALNFFGQDS